MLASSVSLVLALALAMSGPVWAAPTAAQIEACLATIFPMSDAMFVSYSTTNTSNFQFTWLYNPVACTNAGVPVQMAILTNLYSVSATRCSTPSFTQSGTMTVTCPTTYGEIAEAAAAGDTDCTYE
jgi:hypothetical protein